MAEYQTFNSREKMVLDSTHSPVPGPIATPKGEVTTLHHRIFSQFPTAARILMAVLFLMSGIGKIQAVEATQKYMEAYGVPGYLLFPAAMLEIGSGMVLLVGSCFTLYWLAIVLSGWCLLTGGIFHRDWQDQNQLIHFMKNLTMAGGFLVLSESMRRKHHGS